MNIKRMADQYRDQVKSTGATMRHKVFGDYSQEIFVYKKTYIGEARTDIKRWYNHLRKALGSEKDLKELQKVWECLVRLSKLCGKSEKFDDKRQLILTEIKNQMNKFLDKLPRLIEKSLTRAVRESKIRLR